MLTIKFKYSKSKNYTEALRYCKHFKGYTHNNGINMLEISRNDICYRWEYLNLIFQTVLNWKSTVLEYDNQVIETNEDKRHIFYHLQQIHTENINMLSNKLYMEYRNFQSPKDIYDMNMQLNNIHCIGAEIEADYTDALLDHISKMKKDDDDN